MTFLGTEFEKIVLRYQAYCSFTGTSRETVQKAYHTSEICARDRANQGMQPCLIQAQEGPSLIGKYRVVTFPTGYTPALQTLEVRQKAKS